MLRGKDFATRVLCLVVGATLTMMRTDGTSETMVKLEVEGALNYTRGFPLHHTLIVSLTKLNRGVVDILDRSGDSADYEGIQTLDHLLTEYMGIFSGLKSASSSPATSTDLKSFQAYKVMASSKTSVNAIGDTIFIGNQLSGLPLAFTKTETATLARDEEFVLNLEESLNIFREVDVYMNDLINDLVAVRLDFSDSLQGFESDKLSVIGPKSCYCLVDKNGADSVRRIFGEAEDIVPIITWRRDVYRIVANGFKSIYTRVHMRTDGTSETMVKLKVEGALNFARGYRLQHTFLASLDKLNRSVLVILDRLDDSAAYEGIQTLDRLLKEFIYIFSDVKAASTSRTTGIIQKSFQAYIFLASLKSTNDLISHTISIGTQLSELPLAFTKTETAILAQDEEFVLNLEESLNMLREIDVFMKDVHQDLKDFNLGLWDSLQNFKSIEPSMISPKGCYCSVDQDVVIDSGRRIFGETGRIIPAIIYRRDVYRTLVKGLESIYTLVKNQQ